MLNLFCTSNIQADVILWNICLTSSCVRTLVKRFVSNLIWCWTLPESTVWFQYEWPWFQSRSQGYWETFNLYSHSIEKLYEATQIFVMVDFVREVTVKKSCKFWANMDRLSICSSCDNIWRTVGICRVWYTWYCILSCPMNIQVGKPYLNDFLKRT